jgi:hypothetical protein
MIGVKPDTENRVPYVLAALAAAAVLSALAGGVAAGFETMVWAPPNIGPWLPSPSLPGMPDLPSIPSLPVGPIRPL